MAGFEGFPKQTFTFLRGLGRNNNKAWFDAHRPDYEAHFLEPAKAFVEAVGPSLRKLAPEVQAEPRVNGSIFRINRDIRFSKDKTPYKDHLDMWFWEGSRKAPGSAFLLRITAREVWVGAGCHGFDKDKLGRYRKAVVDPKAGKSLLAAVKKVEKAGLKVQGQEYKKLPRGFEADGLAADLLRHSALWAGEEVKHPDSIGSPRFVGWCIGEWKKLTPLHRWLADEIG